MSHKLKLLFLIVLSLLVTACTRQQQQPYPDYVSHPEPLIYRCFALDASQAALILGEPISLTQTIDYATDFCIFASDQPNPDPIAAEGLLPLYTSLEPAESVAVSIAGRDKGNDRLQQITLRLLQNNPKEQQQIFDQLREIGKADDQVAGYNALLAQLARVESDLPNLSRQFIPRSGDNKGWSGALWFWQETANGQHIATLLADNQFSSITMQAWLGSDQTERESQKQMLTLLDYLIEVERNAPI